MPDQSSLDRLRAWLPRHQHVFPGDDLLGDGMEGLPLRRSDIAALLAEVESLKVVLHEVWLAVHVHRSDKQDDATGKPDSFYAGVIHSEQQIGEVAARYGVDYHQLRNRADTTITNH